MTWTALHRLNVPGYIKRTEREAEEQKKARAARDKIKEWKKTIEETGERVRRDGGERI